MIRIARITKNLDHTWTVRVGRQVEHIDMRGKNFAEVVEAIKWALISKDVSLSDIDIITLMHEEENGK